MTAEGTPRRESPQAAPPRGKFPVGQSTTPSMAGYAYGRDVAPGDEVEPIEWSLTSEAGDPVETISGASTDRT